MQRAFERFMAAHHYIADRFVSSARCRKLVEADLYEPPLTVFGRNVVERFFTPEEIRELLELWDGLAA